jgi:hypothetical protein
LGAFDLDKWTESMPKTLDNLPELQEPAAGDAVYATVLSPSLNSGEWMSLRAIEWKDKEATLHVDLWQDDAGRKDNVISMHYLVVQLQTPGKLEDGKWQTAPGNYSVKVAWTFLRARDYRNPGEPYAPENPNKVADIKQLLDHAAAKLTIK